MREWTEVIRDPEYINLLVSNKSKLNQERSFRIYSQAGYTEVQYDTAYVINDNRGMKNAPTHIAVSETQCLATPESTRENIIPHAANPTPAQRAGSIAFIWSPESTMMTDIRPYRDDGFPAVVVAVGLSKHYSYGKLHRNRRHAAIKAEYLVAQWFDRPEHHHRGNGPSSIAFNNYKEFWVDGKFLGQRWTDYNLSWKHRTLNAPEDVDTLGDFLANLNGDTNMFTESYFTDVEDEVCYMADFA